MLLLYWLHDFHLKLTSLRRSRARRARLRRELQRRKAWTRLPMRSATEQLETRLLLTNSPTITVPGAQVTDENESVKFQSATAITVADASAPSAGDYVTLTASHGTITLGSISGLTGVWGNGTASVKLEGSIATLNADLSGTTYAPTSNYTGSDSISALIQNTSDSLSASASIGISVDAPTVTPTGGTTLAFTQGNAAAAIDNNLTLFDAAGTITGATVAITGNFAAGQDVLGFSNQSGIAGSYNSTTGVLTLSGSTTVANYQAALRSVTYQDTSNDPSQLLRTISYSFTDQYATNSNTGTDNVSVTAVNLAPTITMPVSSETIAENTSFSLSGSNATTFADVDANGGTEQVTLTAADGALTLGSTSGLSSVTGNNSGDVVLQGTIANLNTALNGLTYAPNHGYAGHDTVGVSINDEGNTGTGGALSANANLSVTVVGPTITVTGGTTLAYTQGNPPGVIDASLTMSDFSGQVLGATVAITGNFAGSQDVLAFTSTPNITGSYNSSTGVLTLSGTTTIANYQAALRGVTYKDTSLDPSQSNRTISFSFTDPNAVSNTGNDTVTVTAVNQPPTITMPVTSETIGENRSFTLSGANAITVGDVDENGVPDQVTLSATNGTLTLGSTTGLTNVTGNGTGTVVLTGLIANLNTALNGLTYAANTGFSGSDSVHVSIDNNGHTGIGGPQTANATLSVTVVATAITVTGGTTLSYTEGNAPGVIDSSITLSDFSGQVVGATVAITGNFASGEDILQFANTPTITGSYNASTGVLTLTGTDTLANYRTALESVTYEDVAVTPSTLTRTISFSFSDGYATSNVGADNVTVTAVNPPPPIIIPYLSSTIEENTSLTLSGIAAIVVAGNDTAGGSDQVTLSVANGAVSLGSTTNVAVTGNGTNLVVLTGAIADLNAALDGLTYTPTANFAGSDSLQISFDDVNNSAGAFTANAAASISIVTPTLTPTGGTTLNYTQGTPAAAIDAGLTLSDPFSSVVTGATVAITGNFASDEDVLGFTDTANITGSYDSTTGILTLAGNDTLANYQAALRSVTYQNTSDDPSQLARTIAFSYTDTAATSNTGLDTVAVTAVNLPPTITVPVSSQAIGENTSFSLSGANAITVADIDANGVPDQVTLSATHGTLTLGSTTGLTNVTGNGTSTVVFTGSIADLNAALNGLTYTANTNFAGGDSVQVSIYNNGHTGIGGPQTANATVSVTVVAPTVTVTGGTTLNYTEGNSPGVIDSLLTLSDFSGEVVGATVAIIGNFAEGQDILGFVNTANITGSYNASTGVLTLSGADTIANYQSALRSVTYEDTSADPSTQTRTIGFSFTDGLATSNTGNDHVTVTSLGAPPPLTIPFRSETIGENTSLVLSGISAIVVAGPDQTGGTDQVTLSVSHGTLTLGTTTGVTQSGNGTGSITFSGTLAELNTALNGLTYAPTTGYAGADTLNVSFDDESAFGGPVTTNGSVNITVAAPTVTVTGGTTLSYTQGTPAAAIDAGVALADLTTTVAGATVSITGNFASGEDRLGFANTANITGSYNASTGVLTLSGSDTLANYQAALRSVTYADTSNDPSQLARTISFSYTDAVGAVSNTGLDHVAVIAVNLPPTITIPVSSETTNANTPLVLSGASAITVADIDANGVPDQMTVTATSGTLTLASTTGLTNVTGNGTATVSFTGTIANLNNALNGLTYTPNSGFAGGDTIQVSIYDSGHNGIGGPQTASASLSVTVVQPSITTSGVPLNYIQGAPATPIDPNLTLSDLSGTVSGATVAITTNFASGEDVLGFTNTTTITESYNAATGVLTLSGTDTIANYQAALRSVTYADSSDDPSILARTVSFSFHDGNAPSNVATDSVTVMAVHLPPTITAPSGTVQLPENGAFVFAGANTIAVGDVDENGAIDTVTLTATDGSLTLGSAAGLTSVSGNATGSVTLSGTVASLNAALAGLTYTANQNYVGNDTIQVSIEDPGSRGVSEMTANATIDLLVGGPTLAVTGGTTLLYAKGAGAEVIDAGLTLSDSQADPAGATVAITGHYSSGQDVLAFVNTANITGTFDPLSGILTLSGTDTVANYEAALRSVTYANTSSTPSTSPRTITFSFSDAYNDTASGADTISVLNVSSPSGAPTVTNLALVANHGTSSATSNPQITGALLDDPSQNGSNYAVQVSWSGGTVNATVDVTPGTPFVYSLAGQVPYGSVTVEVRGTETTASGPLTGSWTSLTFQYDAPPSFGSSPSFNTTDQITYGAAIGTLTATDPNSGVTLTYSGPTTSVNSFAIGATTGQITYIGSAAPAGGTYNLVFDVSDGLGSVVSVPVTINVTVEHAVATNDTVQLAENVPLTYNVLNHDTVPPTRTVTVAIVTQPQDGNVTIDGTNIDYTPNSNFVGTDTLVYSLTDDLGTVSTATLTIHVVQDPAPIANPDTFSAYSGQTTSLNVLANDSDPASNPLTIVSATLDNQTEGTVTIVPGTNGAPDELSYAPGSFVGTAVITYVITDPLGSTATTTATVTVTQLPAPVVTALNLSAPSGDPNQLITSDPSLNGTVQSTLDYSQVEVQYSLDQGTTVAGSTTVNDQGEFDFNASSALGTNYGQITLYARAAYVDSNGDVTLAGNWDILSFQYVAAQITSPGSTGAATFTALTVATDTTAQVVITGTTTNDANGNTPSIQWNFTGDGIPNGITTSENNQQQFSQTFTTEIGYFTQVIYARTVSGPAGNQLYGAWQEITFYRDPPPASPPDLSNLALADNTGTTNAPATSTAIIDGTAINPDGSVLGAISIQVDTTGDGTPDWSVTPTINPDGSFNVDLDPLLTSDGSITVSLRAAATDTQTNQVLFGDWHTLTFQYSGNAAAVPQVTNVAVVDNTGTSGSPATSDLLVSGIVGGPLADYSWIDVEVSLNRATSPATTIQVNNLVNGTFTVNLSGLGLTAGPVTADLTAIGWDNVKQETITGTATAFSFTYAPAAPPAPVVGSLQLVNDTDPTDGTTADPRVSGVATLNGQPLSEVPVQFELNGDPSPDGTFFTNSDGTFVFDPRNNNIQQGPVTIAFRAGAWSDANGGYQYGAWQTISYTYQIPAAASPSAPTIAGLTIVTPPNSDGSYSNPVVSGIVTASGSTANLPVEFSINDNGVADGTIYTDSTGSGTFTVDLVPYLTGNGQYTVAFRAGVPDPNSGNTVYGAWVTISFTYEMSQLGSGTPPTLPLTSNIPVPSVEYTQGTQFASGPFNFVEDTIDPSTLPSGPISAPPSPGASVIDPILAYAAANTPDNGVPVTTTTTNTVNVNGETITTTDTTTSTNSVNTYQVTGQTLEIQQITVTMVITVDATYPDGSGYEKTENDSYSELVENYQFGGGTYVYTHIASNEHLTTDFSSTAGSTIYTFTATRTFGSDEDNIQVVSNTPPGPLSAFDGQVDGTLLATLANRPLLQNYTEQLTGNGTVDVQSQNSALNTSDTVGNTLAETSQNSFTTVTPSGQPATTQGSWSTTFSQYTPINETLPIDTNVTTPLTNGSVQTIVDDTETLTGNQQITQNESGTWSVDSSGNTTTTWQGSNSNDLVEQFTDTGTETTIATLSASWNFWGSSGSFEAMFQSVLTGTGTLNTTNDADVSASGAWTAPSGGPTTLTSWSGQSQTTDDTTDTYTDTAIQTGSGTFTETNILGLQTTGSLSLAMETDTNGHGSTSIVKNGTYALVDGQISFDITTTGTSNSTETINIPSSTASSQNNTSYNAVGNTVANQENATATGTENVQITITANSSEDDDNGTITDSGSVTQVTVQSGTDDFTETTSASQSTQTTEGDGEVTNLQIDSNTSYTEDDAGSNNSTSTSSWVNGVYTTTVSFQTIISGNYTLNDAETETYDDQHIPIPGGTENSTIVQHTNYGESGTTYANTTGTVTAGVTTATTNTTDVTNYNWNNSIDTCSNESYSVPLVNIDDVDTASLTVGTDVGSAHDHETYHDQGTGNDRYVAQLTTTTQPDGTSSVSGASTENLSETGTTCETDASGETACETAAYTLVGGGTGGILIQQFLATAARITTDYSESEEIDTTTTPDGSYSTDTGSTFSDSCEEAETHGYTTGTQTIQIGGFKDYILITNADDDCITEESDTAISYAGNSLQGITYEKTTSDLKTHRNDDLLNYEYVAQTFNDALANQGPLQGVAINGFASTASVLSQDIVNDTDNCTTQVQERQPDGFMTTTQLLNTTYTRDRENAGNFDITQISEYSVNGRLSYVADFSTSISNDVDDYAKNISNSSGYDFDQTWNVNQAAESDYSFATYSNGQDVRNRTVTSNNIVSTSFYSDIENYNKITLPGGSWKSYSESFIMTAGTTPIKVDTTTTYYDTASYGTALSTVLDGTASVSCGLADAWFHNSTVTWINYWDSGTQGLETVTLDNQDGGQTFKCTTENLYSGVTEVNDPLNLVAQSYISTQVNNHSTSAYTDVYEQTTNYELLPNQDPIQISQGGISSEYNEDRVSLFSSTTTKNNVNEGIQIFPYTGYEIVQSTVTTQTSGTEDNRRTLNHDWGFVGNSSTDTSYGLEQTGSEITSNTTLFRHLVSVAGEAPGTTIINNYTNISNLEVGGELQVESEQINTAFGETLYSGSTTRFIWAATYGLEQGYNYTDTSIPWATLSGHGTQDTVTLETLISSSWNIMQGDLDSTFLSDGTQVYSGSGSQVKGTWVVSTITTTTSYTEVLNTWQGSTFTSTSSTWGSFQNITETQRTASDEIYTVNPNGTATFTALEPPIGFVSQTILNETNGSNTVTTTLTESWPGPGWMSTDTQTVNSSQFQNGIGFTQTVYLDGSSDEIYSDLSSGFEYTITNDSVQTISSNSPTAISNTVNTDDSYAHELLLNTDYNSYHTDPDGTVVEVQASYEEINKQYQTETKTSTETVWTQGPGSEDWDGFTFGGTGTSNWSTNIVETTTYSYQSDVVGILDGSENYDVTANATQTNTESYTENATYHSTWVMNPGKNSGSAWSNETMAEAWIMSSTQVWSGSMVVNAQTFSGLETLTPQVKGSYLHTYNVKEKSHEEANLTTKKLDVGAYKLDSSLQVDTNAPQSFGFGQAVPPLLTTTTTTWSNSGTPTTDKAMSIFGGADPANGTTTTTTPSSNVWFTAVNWTVPLPPGQVGLLGLNSPTMPLVTLLPPPPLPNLASLPHVPTHPTILKQSQPLASASNELLYLPAPNPVSYILPIPAVPAPGEFFITTDALTYAQFAVDQVASADLKGLAIHLAAPGLVSAGPLDFLASEEFAAYNAAHGSTTLTSSVQGIVDAANAQQDLVAGHGLMLINQETPSYTEPVLVETGTIFVGVNRYGSAFSGVPTVWGSIENVGKELEDAKVLSLGRPQADFINLLEISANDTTTIEQMFFADSQLPPPGDMGGGPAAALSDGGQAAINQMENDIALVQTLFGQTTTLQELFDDLWLLTPFPFLA